MEQEQDQEQTQAALYVAVDDGNKIVAMERSRRGDRIPRPARRIYGLRRQSREIPSVLFFDIRTTDAALLPRIEAAEHSYLLDPSTATEKAGHPSRRNAERRFSTVASTASTLSRRATAATCSRQRPTIGSSATRGCHRSPVRTCGAAVPWRPSGVRCSSRRNRTVGRPANATCSITPIVSSTPIWG